MLGKLITIPLWIIQKCFGLVFGTVRIVFGLIFGILRFLFSRSLGAVIGGLIGFFFGKNHVGLRLWKHKK